MTAYYNEMDPYAAEWLRNLIAAGHIAPGVVDSRSIKDVGADELLEYTQCHFFAGIGIWSLALRSAGWPDDRPIWTGSCPCQPFSAAGKQKGFDDERHLWPVWYRLIDQRRPPIVLGEQVASALDWLDLVSADLEASGYALGAADLCAAGFAGAHIRQRLYFVGMADTAVGGQPGPCRCGGSQEVGTPELRGTGGLADAFDHGQRQQRDSMGGASRPGEGKIGERQWLRVDRADGGAAIGMADAQHERHDGRGAAGAAGAAGGRWLHAAGLSSDDRPEPAHAPLLGRDPVDWLYCRDGKWRPVESGTFPLAHEDPGRVGRLRAYGNALDAETAAQFVGAVMECLV